MTLNYFSITLLFLFLGTEAFSQGHPERCGTDHTTVNQHFFGSVLQKKISEKTEEYRAQRARSRTMFDKLVIPVIVHVVHYGEAVGQGTNISSEQVYSQIEVLNRDFNLSNTDSDNTLDAFKDRRASIDIEFVPATRDPDGKPLREPGIIRHHGGRESWTIPTCDTFLKPETFWDSNRYLNMWVLNLEGDSFYGYAQFPSDSGLDGFSSNEGDADTDGIVVDYKHFGSIEIVDTPQLREGAPINLGRTTTHELGHFFGLIHVWGFARSCSDDDYCDDTPRTDGPNFDCETANESCGSLDMAQNFMDYSDDGCMTLFTSDQADRMRAALEVSPRRKALSESDAGEPVEEGVFADFDAERFQVCEGQSIRFFDRSLTFGSSEITDYEWTFEGGSPSSSSEASPTITYNTPGDYEVTLTVRNASENSTLSIPGRVNVRSTATASADAFKSFEDRSVAGNGWELIGEGWELYSRGAYGDSDYSMACQNYTNDYRSRDIRLISPPVDVRDKNLLVVSFDYAYAAREGLSDSLVLYFSPDCGGTFIPFFAFGGAEMATDGFKNTLYRPSEDDWENRRTFLNIENTDAEFIQIAFACSGKRGNNLYIDNISISEGELSAPKADFGKDYELYITEEDIQLRDRSENSPSEYQWSFEGGEPASASTSEPAVRYNAEGRFDVSLTVRNSAGEDTERKSDYLDVRRGFMSSNTGNNTEFVRENGSGYPAGTNTRNDRAKAELFELSEAPESLLAIDLRMQVNSRFGESENLRVSIAALEDGLPGTALFETEIPISEIYEKSELLIPYRLVPSSPITELPKSFFVIAHLEELEETELAFFTANVGAGNNTGWEQTSAGVWQPYSQSNEEGGRELNLSHAVKLLISGRTSGIQEVPLNERLTVFPNPAGREIRILASGLNIKSYVLLNSIGQEVRKGNFTETILVEDLAGGVYLLKLLTSNGLVIKKVVVE